ncbi:hypothetical protein FS749_008831 [Ceratobasidium sp. UAMH 11750]|nr:hypothetical protein FS749_008831 [Ceratobasidium sp. UAMH 11750]
MELGVRKQRGDLAHSVAKYHEKIFGITDERFMDRKKRTELPEVQHLARTFLHTAPDDPLEDFFKDECIVRVLRLLLNGPGAILTGRRSPKSRKPHADMWHIKGITPSLLAFAATVIKFVLSGEPSFEEASGPMNYTDWYLSRLGLLEGVSADEVDTYNLLINYYNRRVLLDCFHEVAFEQLVEEVGAHDNRAGLNGEERAFLACVCGEA